MLISKWKAAMALLSVPALLLSAGCACKSSRCQAATVTNCEQTKVTLASNDLPPHAKPGECFAKFFVPEQFENKAETICVRDASERLELVPAKYEWVEETIVVKEASTRLEEVPAQFENREVKVQTAAGHTGWQVGKSAKCANPPCADDARVADEVYCLVSHEPVVQTVSTSVQVKPATTRAIPIPAEYQTVRRQKVAEPATTRRIAIPAEYATVHKTVKVADSRVEWRRIECKSELQTQTVPAAKDARADAGK